MAEAIGDACNREGPWNIAVAGEIVEPANAASVVQPFACTHGLTGLVCTGPWAGSVGEGPITLVVEDTLRLPAMLRTAERLALALATDKSGPPPIAIVVCAVSPRERSALVERAETLAKTAGCGGNAITIAEPQSRHGTPAETAEAVRRLDARWLLMRGTTDTGECHDSVPAILGVARGPVLLVR